MLWSDLLIKDFTGQTLLLCTGMTDWRKKGSFPISCDHDFFHFLKLNISTQRARTARYGQLRPRASTESYNGALNLNFFCISQKIFIYFSESENSISRQERRARTGRYGTLTGHPAEQAVRARRVSRAQGTSQRPTSVRRCQAHRAHLPAVGKHLLRGFLDFCFC